MKLSRLFAACLAGIALTVGGAAQAYVVIDTTSGYYNNSLGDLGGAPSGPSVWFPGPNVSTGDPTNPNITPQPDLSSVAAILGDWLGAAAPTDGSGWVTFPNTVPTTQAIPAVWASNTETAIVYEINAGYGLTNLQISLGVDNGVYVWFDGVYQLGAMASGGSTLGEYLVTIPGALVGTHYLQILREDHGNASNNDPNNNTGYAIRVTAVPEPAALALLGIGLVGLGWSRRRVVRS